jgi:hypothetical protein
VLHQPFENVRAVRRHHLDEGTIQKALRAGVALTGITKRTSPHTLRQFVVAGAARVAGVLVWKGSGSGPAGVRGGYGNALCLQGVSAGFRIRRSLGCGCGVGTPDRVILAREADALRPLVPVFLSYVLSFPYLQQVLEFKDPGSVGGWLRRGTRRRRYRR